MPQRNGTNSRSSPTPTPIKVNIVALHNNPDLDAIAAYWLAKQHPGIFKGIDKADIEFWPQGPPSDGRTAIELQEEGILCLDVGEGPYDHHPHDEENLKCATDLVAEYLGIQDDITYKRILDYVRMHDLDGPTTLSRNLRETENLPNSFAQNASLIESFSLVNIMGIIKKRYKKPLAFIEWVCGILTDFTSNKSFSGLKSKANS